VQLVERNISIAEAYTCDEFFTTGTMGEISPVVEIEGRRIGNGETGQMTKYLQGRFAEAIADPADWVAIDSLLA
jgi:branched-subunit amino acid aminotransferase/4-amino-4-deoxychorismate lyase